jgi:DNA-binding LytR/AlgR family response regulator
MKVIIIEDEKLSAEYLTNMLKRIDPGIEVIASYDSVKKSIEEFQKGIAADLLFVDIHLADGLSFDIFTQVKINIPIIFTTAYDDYAIKAFKLNSIDYLLKPIGIEELKQAIEKFKTLNVLQNQLDTKIEDISQVYQNLNRQYKNRFMAKIGDSIITIKTEEIIHFVSEDGIVLLVNNLNKRYSIDYTLDQLEKMIDPKLFFRINRKVIIGMNSIQKVSSYFNSRLKVNSTQLDDEACIISRDRVNDFKKWLDGND